MQTISRNLQTIWHMCTPRPRSQSSMVRSCRTWDFCRAVLSTHSRQQAAAHLLPHTLLHCPYRCCAIKACRGQVCAPRRPAAASDRLCMGVLEQHSAPPPLAWHLTLLPYTYDFIAAAAGKCGPCRSSMTLVNTTGSIKLPARRLCVLHTPFGDHAKCQTRSVCPSSVCTHSS